MAADESHGAAQAREALRQSEQRFRLLVESVREYAIYMLDPAGTVVSWNLGAERIKGYSAAEIVGAHFSAFYTPEARAEGRPAQSLATALEQGAMVDEGWRVRRDGSRFWASIVITPLYDREHRHIGFAKVTRDMTERRQREEAERRAAEQRLSESEVRFASFAEHIPGLAWIKDLEGRYIYVNDAVVRSYGVAREAILQHTDDDLLPAELAAESRRNDARVVAERAGIEVAERYPIAGDLAVLRHTITSKFPILDPSNEIHLIGGIAIDISEQVETATALRTADQRRNEFLATLSHELRNPLAPIRNAVHLLHSDAGGVSRDRVFEILEHQLDHLVHLVDDLLEVSRMTSGNIELRRKPTDLRTVLQQAVDAVALGIEAKSQQLSTHLPPQPLIVNGDPVRLTQVVVNLLDNASKYTPERGQIRVSLSRRDSEALIRVRDTGAGIPTDELPHVFDMFAQIDRRLQRTSGGLGIGLALARRLVDMHAGTLVVRSHGLGLGSEFEARFPIQSEVPLVDGAPTPPEGNAIPRGVLIVDDNRDGADSLCLVLAAAGFDARVAYDGASALGMIRGWHPAVVLLDIGMPGLDGYEVAERIRAEPAFNDIRLIALTGWGTNADRERSRLAGFDDHWVKPVDPDRLRTLLAVP